MIYKMTYTANIDINDMITEFVEEEKYMDKGQSTMRGSEIYINLVKYVKNICYENNLNIDDREGSEEDIINDIRTQFEYDFNNIARAEGFLMEENINYYNIVWLENAYEYYKWEADCECVNEAKLESKVNFIMFCVAKKICEDWLEKEELNLDFW